MLLAWTLVGTAGFKLIDQEPVRVMARFAIASINACLSNL